MTKEDLRKKMANTMRGRDAIVCGLWPVRVSNFFWESSFSLSFLKDTSHRFFFQFFSMVRSTVILL